MPTTTMSRVTGLAVIDSGAHRKGERICRSPFHPNTGTLFSSVSQPHKAHTNDSYNPVNRNVEGSKILLKINKWAIIIDWFGTQHTTLSRGLKACWINFCSEREVHFPRKVKKGIYNSDNILWRTWGKIASRCDGMCKRCTSWFQRQVPTYP